MNMSVPSSSNRILYDVPCAVCRDHSSGKHYGVFACDGCAGFFKRSVRRDRQYTCKARTRGRCLVDKAHRNQCRACRLAKCLDVGMNRDAVQHERGPRNSTIRRQMAMFFEDPAPAPAPAPESGLALPPPLNLALNKQNILAPLPLMLYPTPYYTRLRYIAPLIQPTGEPAPNLVMPTEAHALCESAARILFLNVKWVKSVPALASLPLADRLILLVESWRDLFVLATAQFLYPLQLRLLISSDTSASVKDGLEAFERALSEIARVRPDTTEFTCLRGMMVFKTSFNGRREPQQLTLQDIATVAALQDYSRSILNEYIAQTYTLEAARLSQIYDLLQAIRLVPGQAIVDLFFRSTIGEIPIERIICDMFRSEINGAL